MPPTPVGSQVDSHKNAELRTVLEPIGRMAERTGVGIVSSTHFNKGAGGTPTKAIYRFVGSIAFIAAARMAFVVIEDPDNDRRCLFLHAKNNLAARPQGLAFRKLETMVDQDILAAHASWDSEPVTMTADGVMNAAGDRDLTAKDDAIEFLKILLAGGPVAVSALEIEAIDAGYLKPDQRISQSKPFRSGTAGSRDRAKEVRHGRRLGLGAAEDARGVRRRPA